MPNFGMSSRDLMLSLTTNGFKSLGMVVELLVPRLSGTILCADGAWAAGVAVAAAAAAAAIVTRVVGRGATKLWRVLARAGDQLSGLPYESQSRVTSHESRRMVVVNHHTSLPTGDKTKFVVTVPIEFTGVSLTTASWWWNEDD
jgi:hypothetical protein